MYCGKCGNEITGTEKFCPICGTPITTRMEAAASQSYNNKPIAGTADKGGKVIVKKKIGIAIGGVALVALIFIITIAIRSHSDHEINDHEMSNREMSDHIMDWKDPALESRMREITGIEKGPIMLSDVQDITELSLDDTNISDISALSDLKNLENLDLSYNDINDISALSDLKNLENLDLSYNDISDISVLSGLKNLTYLDLTGNAYIQDYSPVEFVPDLRSNQKQPNLVEDIASIVGLEINGLPTSEVAEANTVTMADTAVYNITDEMTIPLKSDEDGTGHYAVGNVSLSLNTKHDDYKTYNEETLATYEGIIKDIIYSVMGKYTREEAQGNSDQIKSEILERLREKFDSEVIYGVSFNFLYS